MGAQLGADARTRLGFQPDAARAGVDSLMSAHVVCEALDPGVPATLSRRIVTDTETVLSKLAMALLVIPALKLSDCGLFDGGKFELDRKSVV